MGTKFNWIGFSVSVEIIGRCEEEFSKFPVWFLPDIPLASPSISICLVVVMEMQYFFSDVVIYKYLDDCKALKFKWSVLSRWKSLQQECN